LAADAVQNALLKASRSWKRFRGDAQVKTWLTRIVIHAVRDAIRAENQGLRKQTTVSIDQADCTITAVTRNDDGPPEQALHEELQQTVHSAIRKLPDRQREVFSLIVWQGMAAGEVAGVLDISSQTVHANLHAARKRLRELLSSYLQDAPDQNTSEQET
jgi:RNA polymerase sigma-70 factor (ECF subfamily)